MTFIFLCFFFDKIPFLLSCSIKVITKIHLILLLLIFKIQFTYPIFPFIPRTTIFHGDISILLNIHYMMHIHNIFHSKDIQFHGDISSILNYLYVMNLHKFLMPRTSIFMEINIIHLQVHTP